MVEQEEETKKATAIVSIMSALSTYTEDHKKQIGLLLEIQKEIEAKISNEKPFHWRFAWALAPLLIAIIATYLIEGNSFIDVNQIDMKVLLGVLAFVVSLAAYLASVSREIVKKLGSENLDNTARRKGKLNIGWTSSAEMQLVLLGLLLIPRIVFGQVNLFKSDHVFNFDNFLFIYFMLILVYMASLHIRVWVIDFPYFVDRKIGEKNQKGPG